MIRTIVRRAMLAGVALTTALAMSACGGGSNPHGSMPGMDTTPSGTGAATRNTADVMFAQMMIPHHRQAVEMSTLAETRAANTEVKALAAEIKAAQDPEIALMTGWLTGWGQPMMMPSDANMGHGGMPGIVSVADMAKLTAATGAEFDRLYCTFMIAHHEGAISMAKNELANGANPAAKDLANRIISSQQAEIEQMRTLLTHL
jgi:uncharacterized protein (DUF305 family)